MVKMLERALIAAVVVLCAGLSHSAYGQDKELERPLVVVGAEGGYSRLQRSGAAYLGGEVGLGFPVWAFPGERLVTVRPSIGVAHRIRGPAGPHSTIFTWSVGAHVFLQRLGD
jgi:hypothetical protein